ncbi:putative cation transport regulator ChaB [Pseudolycoriella hygida]|uniref:Cation transport regulator ChaB n=1 Tax=Pseudolycoriella hygida TaxID=35572 RepID=A0A9Q0S642_9DIPT|nr:putative cation transport regulator ChaB [Pseudolycoriella hygida]
MPYLVNDDLPESVKKHLPSHAQDIYREAFNHAYEQYADPSKRRTADSREVIAHKVAWSAVEHQYHKDQNGYWVKK